jgi:putative ABC transport system ATP-binding protein
MEVSGLSDDQLADIRNHKIGFIFQGFNLLQKLNAVENVELPLIYQGASAKERYERSVEALKLVGLGDRIHHRPTELSGGQQQRVAIARALVGDPPIILADEPTGNLDSKSGKDIMSMLKELHSKGNTIVLITHDNNIAMQAERVVRIQDGQINDDRMVG